jgi:hypothetical protein
MPQVKKSKGPARRSRAPSGKRRPSPPLVKLDPKVQEAFAWEAGHIRRLGGRGFSCIYGIGRVLINVKNHIPHGQFGPWLRTEFAWSERQAENFMSVGYFGETLDPQSRADLERVQHNVDASALFRLVSRPELLGEVVARGERGRVHKQDLDNSRIADAKNQDPSQAAELEAWENDLATLERVARGVAAGAIPAGLSEAQRAGANRRLDMVVAWVMQTKRRLLPPDEGVEGARVEIAKVFSEEIGDAGAELAALVKLPAEAQRNLAERAKAGRK